MAWIDRREAGSGKSVVGRSVCFSTVRDKLTGVAVGCGLDIPDELCMHFAVAVNSPVIFLQPAGHVVTIDRKSGIAKPFSSCDKATFLKNAELSEVSATQYSAQRNSGNYFCTRSGIFCNSMVLPEFTVDVDVFFVSFVTIHGDTAYACLAQGDEIGSLWVVVDVILPFSFLNHRLKFDGIAYFAFEGIEEVPSRFLNPDVIESENAQSIEARVTSSLMQLIANDEKRFIDSMSAESIATIQATADQNHTSIFMVIEEMLLSNTWRSSCAALGIDEGEAALTRRNLQICMSPTFTSDVRRLEFNPLRASTSFGHYIYIDEHGRSQIRTFDPLLYFFNCQSTVWVDSLLSALWKHSQSYAQGGMSGDILRCLAQSTYSYAILLTPDIGEYDPLERVKLSGISSGDFMVDPVVSIVNPVNGKIIPLHVHMTHRFTHRADDISVTTAVDDCPNEYVAYNRTSQDARNANRAIFKIKPDSFTTEIMEVQDGKGC